MTPVSDIDEANVRSCSSCTRPSKQQSQQIANLNEQLEYLKKQLFGRKREKIDPAQMTIFGVRPEDLAGLLVPDEPDDSPGPRKRSKRKGHGRAPFSDDLPRETIQLDVPEEQRCCPDCGDAIQYIGDAVTERGHIVPSQMIVKRYERKKYACAKGHGIKVAPLPDGVVDRGKFEASVYAHVATSKYADHIPLHRLQGMLKRQGVHVAKQTMWEMLVRLDELAAQPILEQMRSEVLSERFLQADETPVRVLRDGEKKSRNGFLWAWRNLRGSPIGEGPRRLP